MLLTIHVRSSCTTCRSTSYCTAILKLNYGQGTHIYFASLYGSLMFPHHRLDSPTNRAAWEEFTSVDPPYIGGLLPMVHLSVLSWCYIFIIWLILGNLSPPARHCLSPCFSPQGEGVSVGLVGKITKVNSAPQVLLKMLWRLTA